MAGKRPAKAAKKKVAKKASKKRTRKKTSTRKNDKGPVGIVIAGRQSIKNLAELKSELEVAWESDGAVHLDAGEAESVDTASLQLLTAFANSMRRDSREVEWTKTSTEFRESAELLDLADALGLSEAAPAKTCLADDGLLPVF